MLKYKNNDYTKTKKTQQKRALIINNQKNIYIIIKLDLNLKTFTESIFFKNNIC